MALPVQKLRELVFQLLYSYDMGKADDEVMIPFMMKELSVTRKTVKEAQELMKKIVSHQTDLDKLITHYVKDYSFDRIQSVERNTLRLGFFELFFNSDLPPKVVIAEVMRLTRKFGSPESSAFINAVLDAAYKDKTGSTDGSTVE